MAPNVQNAPKRCQGGCRRDGGDDGSGRGSRAVQWGCPHQRCSEDARCQGKALGKTIRALGVGTPQAWSTIPWRATSPLSHPASPCPPPSPAPVCRSPHLAPLVDRAAIDARSCLTCSRCAEGAPTMGCLCALAGAEPAAPRLKYKQPRRHLPPRPRSPEGKSAGTPDRSGGEHPSPGAHVSGTRSRRARGGFCRHLLRTPHPGVLPAARCMDGGCCPSVW